MKTPSKGAVAGLLLAALVGGGCGDDETHGVNVCDDMKTAYQPFSAGMVATGSGGQLKIKLVDATPAPPAKGDNTWTIQVLDASDAPMADANITLVKPFMPDHGHGTNVTPEIGAVGADGSAQVTKIDFMMPGVWTVTVDAETAALSDEAVFAFCIDG